MSDNQQLTHSDVMTAIDPARPVLIAGPTASGKSALALHVASEIGGTIINADASQVYDCWRIVTARPSAEEEAATKHMLYGHISAQTPYSVGHWLREVRDLLQDGPRPIIVGGTGLYFMALTQGLADIPTIPAELRAIADTLSREVMLSGLDAPTCARIDLHNRARVQRAWEVLRATGRGLSDWQDQKTAPLLPETQANCILFDAEKDWLNARMEMRFDQMLAQGALDEARSVLPEYDPSLPGHRAIGVRELIGHLRGEHTIEHARDSAVLATRQFAKRQRTWFRSKMRGWTKYNPHY